MKFRASTGRLLTQENMHFLCEKAFKTTLPYPVQNDLTIMWSQFCKEPIPDRSFTFWEWFYAAMKVTREHLRGPWMDGSIIGFIHKSKAEDYLLKCPRGTFLLRFSDSELGEEFCTFWEIRLILDVEFLLSVFPIPDITAFISYTRALMYIFSISRRNYHRLG